MLFLFVINGTIELVKFSLITTAAVMLYQWHLLKIIARWCFAIVTWPIAFIVSDMRRLKKEH